MNFSNYLYMYCSAESHQNDHLWGCKMMWLCSLRGSTATLLNNLFPFPRQKSVFVYKTVLLLTDCLHTAFEVFHPRQEYVPSEGVQDHSLDKPLSHISCCCLFFFVDNVLVIGSKTSELFWTSHETVYFVLIVIFNLLKTSGFMYYWTHCKQSPATLPPPQH